MHMHVPAALWRCDMAYLYVRLLQVVTFVAAQYYDNVGHYNLPHYTTYWYIATICVLACQHFRQHRPQLLQSVLSLTTVGISVYMVQQKAHVLWAMILICAQMARSALYIVTV